LNLEIWKGLRDLKRDLRRPWHRFAGPADIQCAARVKPPPYRNWEIVFRILVSNRFEVSLKWQWKVIKICSKIVAKTVPNHEKSTSGAVLEDFGDPLGAQVAQERQQELKNSKNIGF
jgi:hypothetical protein